MMQDWADYLDRYAIRVRRSNEHRRNGAAAGLSRIPR